MVCFYSNLCWLNYGVQCSPDDPVCKGSGSKAHRNTFLPGVRDLSHHVCRHTIPKPRGSSHQYGFVCVMTNCHY